MEVWLQQNNGSKQACYNLVNIEPPETHFSGLSMFYTFQELKH